MKRCDQTNGTVSAHPKVADVVKEDDAGGRRRIYRFAKQGADDNIGTARFVDDGRAKRVVVGAETFKPSRERALAEVRTALNDDARWFAAGVRINDANSLEFILGQEFGVLRCFG